MVPRRIDSFESGQKVQAPQGMGWLFCSDYHGRGAVEVLLELGPEVIGDIAAEFESGDIVRLDVVSAQDAGDSSEFGDFSKGGKLEGDVAGEAVPVDHFGEGFAVDFLHRFTTESLLSDLAGLAGFDETAMVTAGEELEHLGTGSADGAVAGDVSGKGRGDEVRR